MNINLKIKLLILIAIIFIPVFYFLKIDTKIYVGNYSYKNCKIDIQVKVDDELILDDTLLSSPFFPNIVKKRLRYGYHTVNVYSKTANVQQKNKIFLLPNQHIYIEFLASDTLCMEDDIIHIDENKLLNNDLDWILEKDSSLNWDSRFRVESLFNPFYTE